jgi:hypothetical protein
MWILFFRGSVGEEDDAKVEGGVFFDGDVSPVSWDGDLSWLSRKAR